MSQLNLMSAEQTSIAFVEVNSLIPLSYADTYSMWLRWRVTGNINNYHNFYCQSIILSQHSELVGVFSVQSSQLLLFEIASNFLRRKHGQRCLEVHSDLGSSLLPVCVSSDFITTSLLF